MTKQQLEDMNVFEENLNRTKYSLDQAIALKNKLKKNKRGKDNKFDDGCYWLSIAEHSDGSGVNLKLHRYLGNAQLLDMVISVLEKQVKEFTENFNKM